MGVLGARGGSIWGWSWVNITLLYVISLITELASPHLPSEKHTADACENCQCLPGGATPLVMLDQERSAALQESIKPVVSPECSSSGAATPDPSYQNLISRNCTIFRYIPRTPVMSQRANHCLTCESLSWTFLQVKTSGHKEIPPETLFFIHVHHTKYHRHRSEVEAAAYIPRLKKKKQP